MKKYLIVGLGNIGSEYERTRHNIGFLVVDAWAQREGAAFSTAKLGSVAQLKVKGKQVFLLKPSTYMNLSGKAVAYWMQHENIPLENVLVITDDLNLPFGTLRIKGKGSDGGHNGLKSLQAVLQTADYARLRFGISNAFAKGRQVDYVLGEWDEAETKALPERLGQCVAACETFVLSGPINAMNGYNGK